MKPMVQLLAGVLITSCACTLLAQGTYVVGNEPGRSTSFAPFHKTGGQHPSLKKSNQVYFPDTVTVYSTESTARYSLTYNTMGLPTTTLVEVQVNGEWKNYRRLTVTYDGSGNTLDQLVEAASPGQWTNVTFDTWTYGANGSSVDVQQQWLNGHWTNSTLDSSTFDAKGNMLVHLYAAWEGGHWQDSILSFRTYDANENMLTNFGQYMKNGQWVNNDQSAFTYDADGHQLTSLFQMWVSGQWKNSEHFTYTYDAKGNLLVTTHQSWENDHWGDPYQSSHDYTYDGFGNILTDLIQGTINGQWTNLGNYSYTYDGNGNELTGSYTSWTNNSWKQADGPFIVMLNGESYYFSGYNINISYTLIPATSAPTTAGTSPEGYSLSQNYPNPFNPKTGVRVQASGDGEIRLVVYDLLGREVAVLANGRYTAGEYTFAFDGTNLASGVYFYRLTAGVLSSTRTMLLLK